MNDLLHKYIKITDAKTNKIVCSGVVVSSKDRYIDNNKIYTNIYFVSVDNKHFFNMNNNKFNVEVLNEKIDLYVGDIRKYVKCKLKKWGNLFYKNRNKVDILLDNDINGLDPPVKKLVYSLNKLEDVETDGSCSGHYKEPLWVSCQFKSIKPLILLSKIISNKFLYDFKLCTLSNRSQTSNDKFGLCIVSFHKGKKAYKSADELSKYIDLLSTYKKNII